MSSLKKAPPAIDTTSLFTPQGRGEKEDAGEEVYGKQPAEGQLTSWSLVPLSCLVGIQFAKPIDSPLALLTRRRRTETSSWLTVCANPSTVAEAATAYIKYTTN